MKIFVTGGNGFLGSRTVEELVQKGYQVRCLLRKESNTSRIDHLPFETQIGDVRDPDSLLAGANGCDGIIHLAGISSWDQIRKQEDQLNNVIVDGTLHVLDAAREMKISRTVVVSSAAAINADIKPKVFNETSPYLLNDPLLKYSLAKRKAEQVVHEHVKHYGIDVVVVNPCETYGPKDIGLVTASNLIGLMTNAPAVVCTGGTAVTHVDDVACGIVLAFEKGLKGERYILGGDNLTLSEIARIVRKLAGKSDHVFTLPNMAVSALCKSLAFLGATPPVSLDVLEYASLYWFVDSTKAKKQLGYKPRPAVEVFKEVVEWLIDTKQVTSGKTSMRYGGGSFDARSAMIKLYGIMQRKKVVILNSNPKLCGEVLAASDAKGTFLEQLLATPAWHPIYSIESMDGKRWEQLSTDFKQLLHHIEWRERLTPLTLKYSKALVQTIQTDKPKIVDSESISRLVLRILFELLFEEPISKADETLFYQASLEWRKEIAIKGKADSDVKIDFWHRLGELVAHSKFKEGLESYKADPSCWLSLFAQPFLISPQINISDIFVTVFHYLKKDSKELLQAKNWALENDKARLDGVILESIRLRHPFPILERELKKDSSFQGKNYTSGTHFFILLDQFKQEQNFDPERWLKSPAENPFYSIPFAAGPRMCIGKPIAMELLSELLKIFLLQIPIEKIKPQQGHIYSGRDNDGQESIAESHYQIKVLSSGLLKSFKMGFKKENTPLPIPTPVSGCPWKKITEAFQR